MNEWALNGPDGHIDSLVEEIIISFVKKKKPIVGLCMGPTVIAQALKNTLDNLELTIGTTAKESPYDINTISEGLKSIGVTPIEKDITEIHVDPINRVISAPCYMMQAGAYEVRLNAKQAIDKLIYLIKND